MRKDYTDVTVVLDRSGSMSSLRDATFENLTRYFEDRKNDPGLVKVSLVQFDTEYEPNFEAVKAYNIPHWEYIPRGGTALYDAIGKTIVKTGERLRNMKEKDRPANIIFVIVTDGEENSSQEFRGPSGADRIKEMIKEQTSKYSWEFLFLGVGIDAFAVGAQQFNIPSNYVMSAGHNINGSYSAWTSASNVTSRSAVMNKIGITSDEYDSADLTGGTKNTR